MGEQGVGDIMGLKETLQTHIRRMNGEIVPYDECDAIRLRVNYETGENYKQSNMERRLRPSESPEVETVKKKGFITGYYWKKKPYPSQMKLGSL